MQNPYDNIIISTCIFIKINTNLEVTIKSYVVQGGFNSWVLRQQLWQQWTKNFEMDKKPIFAWSRPATQKIRQQELKVWCLANKLPEEKKVLCVWIQIKGKYIPNLITAVINCLIKKFLLTLSSLRMLLKYHFSLLWNFGVFFFLRSWKLTRFLTTCLSAMLF